jgi:hypothetical protein
VYQLHAQRFNANAVLLPLLGDPGAIQRFTAFIVLPSPDKAITPPPSPGVAEDFGAIRRFHPQWE